MKLKINELQGAALNWAVDEARREGLLDNLEGSGRPIPGLGEPRDGDWWVKEKLRREEISWVPPTLAIRAERDAAVAEAEAAETEDELGASSSESTSGFATSTATRCRARRRRFGPSIPNRSSNAGGGAGRLRLRVMSRLSTPRCPRHRHRGGVFVACCGSRSPASAARRGDTAEANRPLRAFLVVVGGPTGDAGHCEDRRVRLEPGGAGERTERKIDIRLVRHDPAGFGDDTVDEFHPARVEPTDLIEQRREPWIDPSVHLVAESRDRAALSRGAVPSPLTARPRRSRRGIGGPRLMHSRAALLPAW